MTPLERKIKYALDEMDRCVKVLEDIRGDVITEEMDSDEVQEAVNELAGHFISAAQSLINPETD